MDPIIDSSQSQITKTDLKILLPILISVNPKRICEIGTYKGGSAETWIKALSPDKFITIEKYNRNYFDSVIEYPNFKYLWGYDSHDPNTVLKVKEYCSEYDMLFIDGYHSYESVRKDYEAYSPLVRKGGIIIFHDICPLHYEIQVKPLWEELKPKHNYLEIKTDEYSTGIGLLWQN